MTYNWSPVKGLSTNHGEDGAAPARRVHHCVRSRGRRRIDDILSGPFMVCHQVERDFLGAQNQLTVARNDGWL